MQPALLCHWSHWLAADGPHSLAPPLQVRLLEVVRARIIELELAGLLSESILLQAIPHLRPFHRGMACLPGVILSLAPGQQVQLQTNRSAQLVYPVRVNIVAAQTPGQSGSLSLLLQWRSRIIDSLRHRPLNELPQVIDCQADLSFVVDDAAVREGLYHTSFELRFIAYQQREAALDLIDS